MLKERTFLTQDFRLDGARYRVGATVEDGVWVREGEHWKRCDAAESARVLHAFNAREVRT